MDTRSRVISFVTLLVTTVLLSVSFVGSVSTASAANLSSVKPKTFTQLIDSLPVAAEISGGYDRKLFKHWTDEDKDGCDTRREVLIEESRSKIKVGKDCAVKTGRWVSVYDSKVIRNASLLDIDHFVPLKEAWESGAANWDNTTRERFANDLGYVQSLIAVSAGSNRSKSDRDPADWLPTNKSYRCVYVYSWVQVKLRWSLTADAREVSALKSASANCKLSSIKIKPSSKAAVTVVSDAIGSAPSEPSNSKPTSESGAELRVVSPGAFCKSTDKGVKGVNKSGVVYTCKVSDTDTRLRWRK